MLRAMAWPDPPSNLQGASGWRNFAAASAFVSLLVFGLWHPALKAQRVSDDFQLVGRLSFSDVPRYFRESFGFGRNEYRPLTAMSFASDRWIWGDRAEGYHLTNLVLHWAVSVLLFTLLHRWLQDMPVALLAASLFAIHPVTHERVAWISARDGLVSGVFVMAALWLYGEFRRGRRRALLLLALGAQSCALLSYEGAVVLPLLVGAAEAFFFARGRQREALRFTWPFLGVAVGYVLLWWLIFRGSLGAYGLASDAGEAVNNYGRLLYSLFFGHRRLLLAAAYLVVFLGGLTRVRAWRSTAAFGAALLTLAFLPFAVLDGFAHRFGYASAAGFAILLAGGVSWTIRLGGLAARTAAVLSTTLIVGYYVVEVRRILAEWVFAGEIGARLPLAVRRAQPDLPEGAVVMIRGAPEMHRRAVVFPTGLEAAIEQQYGKRLSVRKVAAFEETTIRKLRAAGSPVYCFEWTPEGTLQRVILPP